MARVLVTGMSATGKSTVLRELAGRGARVVEADDPAWSYEVGGPGGEQLWHVERLAALLDEPADGPLVVGGCASNQGRLYDRFDAVVLLSVPPDVLLARLATRTTNAFGRHPQERERVLRDLAEVEPLLRASATLELDTRRPLREVVLAVERLAGAAPP